jgi:hypothetical protein
VASSVVGILKVLLTAETAEFKTGLDQATKMTGEFSGKLTGLQTQLAGFGRVFGTLFTVGAITSAAKQVLEYADRIEDLADQTGLSVEALQEMDFAARQTGTTLEGFTNVVFKLGTNLAAGTKAIRDAVEALGLSYEALRQLSPEDQFREVAKALSEVENVQERNRLGVILMGKGYKEVAGAINEGYDEMARRASKSSTEQIDALAQAGKEWDAFQNKVMNVGVMIGASFAKSMSHLATALKQDFEFIKASSFDLVVTALEDWQIIFGKAAKGADVLGAATKNLPAPLEAVNISVEEQEKRMKALEAQHGRVKVSTREVGEAQEEVDENIQRLTASFEAQIAAFRRTNTIANSVHESFRLLRVDFTETIPVLQNLTTNGFEPFKASLTASGTALRTWADTAKEIFGGVPQAIVNAIQGGGSIIGAAGASMGVSLMSKFQATFGPAIKAALPFGIGEAINALLPTLGALFGPIAQKIGSFFRNIFGGPSAEEMRGREAVAAFEGQLHELLDATQRAEAGNEDWKKTVIAIRDAYLAAGRTEAEAMAAAERLWQSSKKGAAETAAAIAAIQAVLDQTKSAADEAGDALDHALRDRTVRIEFDTPQGPENHGYTGEGFATGTMGQLGKWFGDFGAGVNATLHGMEAVVTPQQAPAFAMDVLSGLNAPTSARGQAQPTTVRSVIDNRIFLDGRELKNWIQDTISTAIENNERGFRTRQRDALGIG